MDWGSRNNPQPPPVPQRQGTTPQVCPFLGTCNDPQTRYSFPETLNCCHRVSRPQRVALDHQQDVCLSGAGAYRSCQVYSPDWKGPLPKELRGIQHQAQRTSRSGLIIGSLVVVVLAVIFIISRFTGILSQDPNPTALPLSMAALTSSAMPAAIPSDTPEATLVPTEPAPTLSPTNQVTATITQTPTSATPTRGPIENTPFGPGGRYLVHVVKEGELMDFIATQYKTTTRVLKALNGLKPDAGFWPGVPVVVAAGEVDPNNVFAMQAVWIAAPVRVDVLAAKYTTPEDELRSINDLGTGDTVPGGRWIVARKIVPTS